MTAETKESAGRDYTAWLVEINEQCGPVYFPGEDADKIALDAAHQIEALPSYLHEAQKTAHIQLIVLSAMRAPPPQVDSGREEIALEDRVMKALRKAGLAHGQMIVTKWKDGIDIDTPSHKAMIFADAILSGGRE